MFIISEIKYFKKIFFSLLVIEKKKKTLKIFFSTHVYIHPMTHVSQHRLRIERR